MFYVQRPTIEARPTRVATRQEFEIGPLEPGFGHTIGNSLRRILLSSIPGAAVTQVRFDQAIHEFGVIDGVATDIFDIILNMKDLVITLLCNEPVTLRLDIRGPGEVIAGDILPHPDVQILNREQPIAMIEGPDRLAMDITVALGRGYIPAEQNKQSTAAINVIPVDSLFSPVRRVGFRVDTTRVEQSTDYDLLVLDVETDGSISPREALASAGATLAALAGTVAQLSDEPQGLQLSDVASQTGADDPASRDIESLELTERPRNCLKRAQIDTVEDLLQHSRDDLLAITNFGDKSLEEVVAVLDEQGLALRGDG